jgi:hypothetical protein
MKKVKVGMRKVKVVIMKVKVWMRKVKVGMRKMKVGIRKVKEGMRKFWQPTTRPGSVARWSVHCNKYNFLEFPGVCAVYQVLKFSCRIFSLQEI